MRTLVTESGGREWRRDLRLLLRMAGMLFQYATAGARLRRAYRRCQARGQTLWLDADGAAHPSGEGLQK